MFQEKEWQNKHLEPIFCHSFDFLLPASCHISDVSFDRKRMKFLDLLSFITENPMPFFHLSIKPHNFRGKGVETFSKKIARRWGKKLHARKHIIWKTNSILSTENGKRLSRYFRFNHHISKFLSLLWKYRF